MTLTRVASQSSGTSTFLPFRKSNFRRSIIISAKNVWNSMTTTSTTAAVRRLVDDACNGRRRLLGGGKRQREGYRKKEKAREKTRTWVS